MSTELAERNTSVAKTMEQRLASAIDKNVSGGIGVSQRTGLVVTSMAQAMEFAKLMSLSREAIPKHLRESPGACLALAIQAYEWQINPFALANKSYVVNDRLCFEASLYQSVVARRAPITGRIKMEYIGEDQEKRRCRVWAELSDGTGIVEYTSPPFAAINPKNSPLWKNDPDQQLFYFSVRSFARRHFPDVMMGIYTVDEMVDDAEQVRVVEARMAGPSRASSSDLNERLSAKAAHDAAEASQDEHPAAEAASSGTEPAETTPPVESSGKPTGVAIPSTTQTPPAVPDSPIPESEIMDENLYLDHLEGCDTLAAVERLSFEFVKPERMPDAVVRDRCVTANRVRKQQIRDAVEHRKNAAVKP